MTAVLPDIVLWLGAALLWLGGMGLLRSWSPYDRLQAAGVADIGGVVLVLVGLIVHMGFRESGGIPLVLLAFLVFTGPLATHAIAKAAFIRKERFKE